MKMICSILLLLSLTSCVSGAFVVNVTQTSYQAEENHNITLEWMFTPRTSSSSKSLYILCRLFANHKYFVMFHLEGVELPESQHEHFAGRVRWDKDVLRDGRIRLHMSRLWFGDSGVYRCDVKTDDGRGYGTCHLDVTAADEPTPPRWGWNILSVVLIALLVLCAGLCIAFIHRRTRRPIRGNNERDVQPI